MRFPEQIPFELIKATVFGIQIFNTRFSSEKRENTRCHGFDIYIYNKSEQLEISSKEHVRFSRVDERAEVFGRGIGRLK